MTPQLTARLDADFWNAFGSDWRENCRSWQRPLRQSALPPSGDSWQRRWTANPAFFERDGELLLFYRGNGDLPNAPAEWHDRLGVATVQSIGPGGLQIAPLAGGLPIVDVGAPGEFDADHALDPTTCALGGQVFVYYSAVGPGDDQIGAARSRDGLGGVSFEKIGSVLTGRSPSALARGEWVYQLYDERVYLLYQKFLPGAQESKRYAFYLAHSDDGLHFAPAQADPILAPTPGEWDGFSIVTGRLHGGADGWAYLLYGGSASKTDEPEHFGLARSRDLLTWEKHPGNPIFGAGARGEPDGGAIWFPAVCETPNGWAMLYEGSSGTYDWHLQSEICLAWLPM